MKRWNEPPELAKPAPRSLWLGVPLFEWPLKEVGDKEFFGYVVAVGILSTDSDDWKDGKPVSVAVFEYNNDIRAYRLPDDKALREDLMGYLEDNSVSGDDMGGVYGKVWIGKQPHGYDVYLP